MIKQITEYYNSGIYKLFIVKIFLGFTYFISTKKRKNDRQSPSAKIVFGYEIWKKKEREESKEM